MLSIDEGLLLAVGAGLLTLTNDESSSSCGTVSRFIPLSTLTVVLVLVGSSVLEIVIVGSGWGKVGIGSDKREEDKGDGVQGEFSKAAMDDVFPTPGGVVRDAGVDIEGGGKGGNGDNGGESRMVETESLGRRPRVPEGFFFVGYNW